MTLVPVTQRDEIGNLVDLLIEKIVESGPKVGNLTPGFQGGGGEIEVWWLPKYGIWASVYENEGENHYWCPYGLAPKELPLVSNIVCEINPMKDGASTRCGGMFVRDARGRAYLGHTGIMTHTHTNPRGQRDTCSREEVLSYFQNRWLVESVALSKGQEADIILVGCLEEPDFLDSLAQFVRETGRFKDLYSRSGPVGLKTPHPLGQYRAEFQGARVPYERSGIIRSWCEHGRIVEALRQEMARRGKMAANDIARDLIVPGPAGQAPLIVFEVKTTCATSDIYAGIGQLLYHGREMHKRPRLALVLPDSLSAEVRKRLGAIGIDLVSYVAAAGGFQFQNLDGLFSEQE